MASLSAFAMGVEEMSEPRTHHGVAGALSHSYVPKSKLIDLVLMHQNSTIPFVNFSSLCKLFNAAEVTNSFFSDGVGTYAGKANPYGEKERMFNIDTTSEFSGDLYAYHTEAFLLPSTVRMG